MGAEAVCDAVVDGRRARGKAKLERRTVEFRAPELKAIVAFDEITEVAVNGPRLVVCAGTRALELALGEALATRWADKILHPPSRAQKLGVKPGWRVALVGDVDKHFAAELAALGVTATNRLVKNADAVFVFVKTPSDFERISAARAALADRGALWLVRRKGNPTVGEAAVMRAGRTAGLVDVKVVAFSDDRSALKFVRPKTKV